MLVTMLLKSYLCELPRTFPIFQTVRVKILLEFLLLELDRIRLNAFNPNYLSCIRFSLKLLLFSRFLVKILKYDGNQFPRRILRDFFSQLENLDQPRLRRIRILDYNRQYNLKSLNPNLLLLQIHNEILVFLNNTYQLCNPEINLIRIQKRIREAPQQDPIGKYERFCPFANKHILEQIFSFLLILLQNHRLLLFK